MMAMKQRPLLFAKTWALALLLGCTLWVPAPARSQAMLSDRLLAVSADIKLRVIEAGPPEAQTIVLIPGWCFTADIWGKQIAALSQRYHVVAFDPRSQGSSTLLDYSNSPDHRAVDIANLIKTLHLHKPVLVGWSQGVQDVAAYALAFGTAEVGGLVLVDATVSAGAAEVDIRELRSSLGRMPFYATGPREYLEAMMPYIFKQPLSPGELDTIVGNAMRTPSSVGVANLVLDFMGKDYRRAFRRIAVPTLLVVAGTAEDRNEQLQQAIPGASSVVVEGAGHAVFYDQPARFNQLLMEFVEQRVKGKVSQ